MNANGSPDDDLKVVVPDDIMLKNDEALEEPEEAVNQHPDRNGDSSRPIDLQKRKWNRLRKHYHDQYLDAFKETFEMEDTYVTTDLPPTQLGAIMWHPDEKARLYDSLCRKDRHDLRTLSKLVGSKSEIEIKAYLDNLRDQETDRQRFESQPKNLSHAGIPAAFEIGSECEAVLERAADALLAFQEQYDTTAAQQANTPWLIDDIMATELDRKADENDTGSEMDEQVSGDEPTFISASAFTLFRLSTFPLLSERLFMNRGIDDPDSWQNIAEDGQRPALSVDCVTLLYDLIVNYLRRLVQSCLFLAKSRIRAATSRDYRPAATVKSEDVTGGLDVLGVERNAQSYWVGLARRNGLKIVDDAHRRGVDSRAAMPYDNVEDTLSGSGRSRSISTAPGASSGSDTSSEELSESSGSTENEIDADNGLDTEDDNEVLGHEILPDEEADGGPTHTTDEDGGPSEIEKHPTVRMSRQKRLRMLEDEQDEYLERMDQVARQQEESRLLSLLGADDEANIKVEEVNELGVRPRAVRKSVEDCMGWSIDHQAEWESHAKRRKLDSSSP